jgi:hypothetical protein
VDTAILVGLYRDVNSLFSGLNMLLQTTLINFSGSQESAALPDVRCLGSHLQLD